ncbi:hypothetical protein OHJ28_17830 [Dickeya fangzhongdai]|uniref:hypothetical protein n=1 Tax=Dickeya fangzhongdai TaxID=1778540 RepID=UPI003307ABBC
MDKRESVDTSRPTGLGIEQCKKIASESRKTGERCSEKLREQAINSYADYQNSGEHLTGKEVSGFLHAGKTGYLPDSHN